MPQTFTPLVVLALSFALSCVAPASGQDHEVQRLRSENRRLAQRLRQETSRSAQQGRDLARLQGQLRTLQQTKDAELRTLRQQLTQGRGEQLKSERRSEDEARRLANERDRARRETTRTLRDQALYDSQMRELRARLERQLRRSLETRRCVGVSFEARPLRAALADLRELSGVPIVLSYSAERKAKRDRLSLSKEHVSLASVLDEVAKQTGLEWFRSAGGIRFEALTTTPSGLRYRDLVVGKGPLPQPNQTLRVRYVGRLKDGREVARSADKEPLAVALGKGQLVKGLEEGLATIRLGGKRRLVLPPELAYGAEGSGEIPPGATLVFEVELVGLE